MDKILSNAVYFVFLFCLMFRQLTNDFYNRHFIAC